MQEAWVQSLGPENTLQEDVATHSSNLAKKILWTEGLVGYHSWGCKAVEHD